MRIVIKLNKQQLAAETKKAAMRVIRERAEAVGVLLKAQTQKRFDESGDEEIRWAPLWANNDRAVGDMADLQESGSTATDKRKTAYQKALKRYEKNKTNANANKLRIAKEQMDTRNTSYRRGGKPELDTGALRASIDYRTTPMENGYRVSVGSPLPYAKWQNDGFSTKGPNYIPLTMAGAKKPLGVDPESLGLVRGYDYVMAWNGVTVPARPFIRITPKNINEIKETFGLAEAAGA